MRALEQIQTECSVRASQMDLVMQGEDINPMAPNSEDTSGSNMAATITSSQRHEPPASLAPSQPVFSRAAPGKQFGFRVPDPNPPASTQAPPHKHFSPTCSTTSSQTSTSPASLFSGRSSSGASTALTSRTSSVCSSTSDWHTYSQVAQQQHRSSYQSTHSLASENLSGPRPSDYIPQSLRFEDFEDPEPELPRSTARLQHTASFYHMALSMDGAWHSVLASPHVGDEETIPQVRLIPNSWCS